MTLVLRVAAIALVMTLASCGKRQEAPASSEAAPTAAPPDELAEIIALEAKLYRDDLTADPERCPDACVISARICELSTRICELSATSPKCTDGAARCTKARGHVDARCTCSDEVRGAAPDAR